LLLILFCGCASYSDRVAQIRSAYYSGTLESAQALADNALKSGRNNADVLHLEQAMIQLAEGEPQQAERTLREVRDRFDELERAELAGKATAALSYLSDDQSRVYHGEDYEKILIRAFLGLSNLMHDGGDAEAYSLQVIDKQNQIIEAGVDKQGQNPKANYPRVALAPYLRGLLREATHVDYDDAQRSYEAVAAWQPQFPLVQADLQRVTQGVHSAKGNGVLYVFTLVGRGPYKQVADEIPSTAALLIAGEILSAAGGQTVPPNIATIKVPQVVAQINEIASVGVDVDAQPVGQTETVTDVTELAVNQYAAIYPQVIGRAVARRVVKKGVIYGAKEATDIAKGTPLNLAVDIAGVAWEATETADTRCWGLLPDKIQVLRIELPAGEHNLALRGLYRTGNVSSLAATQRVTIADGRNTYVLASFPTAKPVGKVLVSQP
jgi:tetratricopeptide (TPR) repeat protein